LPATSDLLALHLEGLNLISQHKFKAAEAVLLTLVSKSQRAFVPRFNLAIAQLNQAEKRIDRALKSLTIADKLKPDDPRVHYTRGIIHRFLGEEEAALRAFQNALTLAVRDADGHYQVAIGLIRTGKNMKFPQTPSFLLKALSLLMSPILTLTESGTRTLGNLLTGNLLSARAEIRFT
jgi:tetratricopeptide (TPR) repeat protein